MDLDFRHELLSLLKDGKDESILLKPGEQFIEELAYKFRTQLISEGLIPTTTSLTVISEGSAEGMRYKDIMIEISKNALNSLISSEDFARFIYLADINLASPRVREWLKRAYEKYPKSTILKFICALSLDLERVKFIAEALHYDSVPLIHIQEAWTSITERTLQEHQVLQLVEERIKKIFTKDVLSEVSALDTYRSLMYTQLAEYCIEAKLEQKALRYLKNALSYFKNNSYALVLQARLKAEDDDVESENIFKKALNLVDDQFIDNIQQNDILARINLGLGDIYFSRMLHNISDKYYSKALDLHPEPFLEATILLNRGRNRIYKYDVAGAKRDLSKAEEEPLLSSRVHNNFGLLYYKAGLNEKAKYEFSHAIEQQADLSDAYYNLGVLYDEEGDRKTARKLFRTALDIDGDYKEARDALKKLKDAEINSLADWVGWWFGSSRSNPRKAIGISLLILAGIMIGVASYRASIMGETPSASLIILGVTILILLLPSISSLKIGPLALEMESKGASTPPASPLSSQG